MHQVTTLLNHGNKVVKANQLFLIKWFVAISLDSTGRNNTKLTEKNHPLFYHPLGIGTMIALGTYGSIADK